VAARAVVAVSDGLDQRGGASGGAVGGASPPPSAVREAVRAGHGRLITLVAGLGEEQARGASDLPGWSRAHVLTHLTDLARAFTRQTRAALAGQLVEVYDGGRPGRDASIEAGSARPATVLVADLRAACTELDQLWAHLEPDQWSLPSRYRDATLHEVLLCRWREVEVHASDLALGLTPSDWTPQLCSHLLAFLAPRVPAGLRLSVVDAEPGATRTTGTGAAVTGHLPDLAAWLAGRTSGSPLHSSTGSLPDLRPWP